ncbi:hypothetical protein [Bacillus sp. FJAT-26390]|uniref:hypothetical protein n=1 Tax=Bacillus sp. FJAT-26390 TaxID=1743142 RepID=UPI000807FD40|nr:hypothetical protein [Bacillus sp. FJAT-26390]OBZ15755.1 hypothetical protein A7975_30350 [Bacillus sp. FJAT-26390]
MNLDKLRRLYTADKEYALQLKLLVSEFGDLDIFRGYSTVAKIILGEAIRPIKTKHLGPSYSLYSISFSLRI